VTGDERRAGRERMRELLDEIATLEGDRERMTAAIRETKRLNAVDFEDRVRAGIVRLNAADLSALRCPLCAQPYVRRADGGHIADRPGYHGRFRGDRRIACVTFTGLENYREQGAKLTVALEAAAADPIVRDLPAS
jgi:hypothetical protein